MKLDMALEHLVENAINSCKPPEQLNVVKRKERPVIEQYLLRLTHIVLQPMLNSAHRLPGLDCDLSGSSSVPAGTPQKGRFRPLCRCADFCWPTGSRQKHFVPWRASCCLAIH
jgi:hypothetical protein